VVTGETGHKKEATMINRDHFYSIVRLSLYCGTINTATFAALQSFLDYWESDAFPSLKRDPRYLAYILATVYLETDKTMRPIEEYGRGAGKPYGKKLKYGRGPGKRVPYARPDHLYYGRGHTQNTWYENYEALTKAATRQGYNWDFLNNPELLLQVQPSLWATFYAMSVGLYTGARLSDFFNASETDWENARRIINGLDKADLIASYAKIFHLALMPVTANAVKK
jgi:hypothetical protein